MHPSLGGSAGPGQCPQQGPAPGHGVTFALGHPEPRLGSGQGELETCSTGCTWLGSLRSSDPAEPELGKIPVVHQCCVDRMRGDREEGQQLLLQALQRALQGEQGLSARNGAASSQGVTASSSPASPLAAGWQQGTKRGGSSPLQPPRRGRIQPCQSVLCMPRAGIVPTFGAAASSLALLPQLPMTPETSHRSESHLTTN